MGKRKILIVDDDLTCLTVVKVGLEQRNYEVRAENDSQRALDAARNFIPDLVVLDLVMPGKDGGTVADEIRYSSPKGKDLPIIFLTSLMEKGSSSKTEEQVTREVVLGKPVNVDKLASYIESILARKS